jgi:alcohol dehydrogenase
MLGAAHACANPLTARYGVAHGAAVALLLPHVVRFNSAGASAADAPLAADPHVSRNAERLAAGGDAGPAAGGAGYAALDGCASGEELAARIEALRRAAGLPARLREVGVEPSALDGLAREAAEQWTAGFNPRPVGAGDLLRLYEQAY